jgi:hypothetical protein
MKETPISKITIWHEFDNKSHFNHKTNITIR